MGVEIERKFLPSSDDWRDLSTGITYRQGYLYTGSGLTDGPDKNCRGEGIFNH